MMMSLLPIGWVGRLGLMISGTCSITFGGLGAKGLDSRVISMGWCLSTQAKDESLCQLKSQAQTVKKSTAHFPSSPWGK